MQKKTIVLQKVQYIFFLFIYHIMSFKLNFFFVKTIATKNIFLHLYLQYHFGTSNCIFKKQNFVVVVLMLGEIPPLSLKYYLL